MAGKMEKGYSKALGLGKEKTPGIAAVFSFFFMGLGQIYNGQIGKRIGFIIVYAISWLLMFLVIGFITTPILTAEEMNANMGR